MAKTKKNSKIITLLFFTLLINMVGFSMIIPIKPQLIMDITGGDVLLAVKWGGYLLFGYAFGQFLMSPIVAELSDKYGRKPVLITSILASSIDLFMMGFVNHIGLLLLVRFFLGVFSATIATVNLCVVDFSPPEKRAINFSIITSAIGLGLMLGPFLGGILGELISTRAPLFVGAFLFIINLILIYFLVPETLLKPQAKQINWRKLIPLNVFKQLKSTALPFPFLVASFFYQLAFHSFTAIWSYYMIAKFEWGFMQIGWSLLAVGLSNFLVQNILVRILVPKLGEHKVFFIGALFIIPAFYGFATVNTAWVIYIVIIIGSLGALMKPCLRAIMSSYLPYHKQGELMGALTSIHGISLMLGPLIMTQTFSLFTTQFAYFKFIGAPFILSMLLAISATVITFKIFLQEKKMARNTI